MTFSVLNTRPSDQAAELTRRLLAAGFTVFEAPAIETHPAWEPATLRTVQKNLAAGKYAWVILPSQNAGQLIVDALRLARARVVCGAASARALGLEAEYALDRFSASAALEVVSQRVRPGQTILVPRAADASGELIAGLQALGARVDSPIAYRTLAVDPSTLAEAAARLAGGEVSAVSVCSPSAITSLLSVVGRESLLSCKLICLGATTAEAAHQAHLRVDGIAKKTTMASLVDAVRVALTRSTVPA